MGLVGALAGGVLGGLGGLLGGGPDPTYNNQTISDAGQKALDNVNTRANENVEDRTNTAMSGVKDAANTYTHAMDQAKPEDINSALQSRLDRKVGIATNQLKNQSRINAVSQKGVDIMTAAHFNQAKYQLDRSQSDAMLKANRDQDVLRNNIVGSIFGSMGSLAGQALSMRKSGSILGGNDINKGSSMGGEPSYDANMLPA